VDALEENTPFEESPLEGLAMEGGAFLALRFTMRLLFICSADAFPQFPTGSSVSSSEL